ncbi:GEVED domain-containing protein [Psychroserpens sp. MEBiC05023]
MNIPNSLAISTVFIIFFSIVSNAQQCGFDKERERLRQDPNFVQLEQQAEARIQNAIALRNSESAQQRMSNVLNIPVVVHVLHLGESEGVDTNISDAQIQSSIDNLNYFYGGQSPDSPIDFEIQFGLAQRDPNCNPTTGINRIDASSVPGYSTNGVSFFGAGADETVLKDLSRWPETDYFNIWIVTEIDGNNGGSGFQGYANFYFGNAYEGSVMMYTVFGYDPNNANPSWNLTFDRDNSTVVHEAGHYFHLYHTFQGDDTNNDGISDTCPEDLIVGNNSDGCADTVPHLRETSTCPVNNTCTGNPWVDDNTIYNIMSYYSCTDRLTEDQKTRTRAAMEGTSLVNSKGSLPVDPSFTAPTGVCATNSAGLNNFAGIFGVELNGVTFGSSTTGIDGGNIDVSGNCSNYFEIDASVPNELNVDLSNNFQQLGVWIDWNDDGDFNDDAEQQYLAQDIPGNSTVTVPLIYPTSIPYDDYVRIRLIEELDDRYSNVGTLNSSCYTSLFYGQSEDYTIYVRPAPVTYIYNNGWSPSNPNGVSTAIDFIEIVSGHTTISVDTQCNRISVEGGAALTVDSGVTLTSNSIDLNSTSLLFSSIIVDGTVTGTVNYNRHVALVGPTGTNDLISSPLAQQEFGVFATANLNLPASGTLRAFAPYNTSSGTFENFDIGANTSTIISSGTGYRTATTDDGELTFTGTILTADVLDIPISDASAGSGWNLIGNPYPSYIDFNAFFTANQSEFDSGSAFQAIYGYDGDLSNGWTVWNLATIADGAITELIAPGQAFFVKAKSGGGLVDFTTAMRVSGSSDDFIQGRNDGANNVALCKLNLSSANNNAFTSVYFIDGTTRGQDDGYDAGSYFSNAGEFSIFTNLVEDNTGLDIAIQSLPYEDFSDVSVPVGIHAEADIELVISLDNNSTIPPNINIYLEDTQANTLTLLNDSNYTFMPAETLSGTGRFFLRYSGDTLSQPENTLNSILVYTNTDYDEIIIKGTFASQTEARLYDIQGRLVLSEYLDESNSFNRMHVPGVSPGVYIVNLSNGEGVKTQKLILK